jgi:hypothetical protein
VQGAGAEHLVAVVRRLLLEEFPAAPQGLM